MRINEKIENEMNKVRLKKKFIFLYIFCVIIPLIFTDCIIIKSTYNENMESLYSNMNTIATSYAETITNVVDYDKMVCNGLYMNSIMNNFLNTKFESTSDYYKQYYDLFTDSFLDSMSAVTSNKITVYADNNTIVNSPFCRRLSSIAEEKWYSKIFKENFSEQVFFYYDDSVSLSVVNNNKFLYVRKLDYYKNGCTKYAVVMNNNNELCNSLRKIATDYDSDIDYDVCICTGNYVIYTNKGSTIVNTNDFYTSYGNKFVKYVTLPSCTIRIEMYYSSNFVFSILKKNFFMILLLIALTIFLPLYVLFLIERNIVGRINKLSDAFATDDKSSFKSIGFISGTDEIASMMNKYNLMVDLTNDLINENYLNKIKKQENDLARKNAELLALQSQINPHFMFNALESIRMHSIIKGEDETAEMVSKLALMQRQNVEWGNDLVTIKKEMESVEAYLFLQSYRFGDRLSFKFEIDKKCEKDIIPKLTIVTFVENSCIHGIESKSTPGWIFVRVNKDDENLVIEIEDTGGGMSDSEVKGLLSRIDEVSIETIKGKKHVGVLNACLRLKMITEDRVKFSIESEEGIGLCFTITIPIDSISRNMHKETK